MKNLLFIFALLIFSSAKSQNTFNIWLTNSDTVRVGDSAWVDAYISYSTPSNIDTMRLYIWNVTPGVGLVRIFNMAFKDADTLPRYNYSGVKGNAKLTRIHFVVPNIHTGPGAYSGWYDVYVKPSVSGVEEYSLNKRVKSVEYYNLLGQIIKTTDHIERKNLPECITIEKVFYDNGQITTTKTIPAIY